MTEYETDPQRHESSSNDEPSHTPADASHESSNPARGQSDTTAQQPTLSRQPAAPQSGIPQSGIPQSGASQSGASQPGVSQPGGFAQSGAPQAGYPQSGAPQHQPGAWLASPWQRGAQHPGQPVPG